MTWRKPTPLHSTGAAAAVDRDTRRGETRTGCLKVIAVIRTPEIAFTFTCLSRGPSSGHFVSIVLHTPSAPRVSMAESYSLNRVFCADYLNRHKKKLEYQRNFRSVKDLHSSCPTAETLTAPGLGVPDDDEVLYAAWEKGELIRKEVSPVAFVEHLRVCLRKWVQHEYIRREQGKTISEAKQFLEKGNDLLHFDFAENWTVVLHEEVQSYHWQKTQVSIFTCVVTTRKGTRSCALISDDTSHDSAHAC